jgi:hypothetical protein
MHGATIDTVSIRFVSYNKMWTAIASSHLSAQLSLQSPLYTRDLLPRLAQELAFSCIVWKEAQATNLRNSEHQISLAAVLQCAVVL